MIYKKEDYLDKLITDTLKKKPVNSDHFSIVRKIHPNEVFTKNPNRVIQESHVPLNRRIKETMENAGFAYGRLREKSWGDNNRDKQVRIVAPGPTIGRSSQEPPKVHFNDQFRAKFPRSFEKPSLESGGSRSVDIKKPSEVSTCRFLTQSPSQRQAKEYLQLLNAITPDEKKILQHKIDLKVNDYRKELNEKVPKVISSLNNRGIFSTELNEFRASSMLNVKLKNQMKVELDPIVRKIKAEVLKDKMTAYNETIEKTPVVADFFQAEMEKRNKLLKYVGETVSKGVIIKGDKEMENTFYNSDYDWTEALTQSMNKAMVKCTPKFIS
jgi:cell fate (sporulation/competence/biofilm development) regulator YmcA (YheA/YmcA/DUF963 family)